MQVEIGDVRLLLPLSEEDSAGALERSRRGQSLSEMPDSPDGSEAPAFFVVVIGGFSIGSAERRPGARSRTTTSDAGGRGDHSCDTSFSALGELLPACCSPCCCQFMLGKQYLVPNTMQMQARSIWMHGVSGPGREIKDFLHCGTDIDRFEC